MLTALVYPKVNLFLEIENRRPDGFHNIVTLMQTVKNIHDVITVEDADELVLTCDDHHLPTDEKNLIILAAIKLREYTSTKRGAKIHLAKNIPAGGGLGGGSADAATALKLCNQLWQLNLPLSELANIAAEIGSDVPFFLDGEIAICRGRGEIISPLNLAPFPLTIIIPPWRIATASAYQAINPQTFSQHSITPFLSTINNQDGENLVEQSFNIFEETVFSLEPRQRALSEYLISLKMPARLSGSGSCMWTKNLSAADKSILEKKLRHQFDGVIVC